jgi:hypothetical protein
LRESAAETPAPPPAPAPAPAPEAAAAPEAAPTSKVAPTPKVTPPRSAETTEVAHGNAEAKPPSAKALVDGETVSLNRSRALRSDPADQAWSRVDGDAGRAETTPKKDAAPSSEPVIAQTAFREAASPGEAPAYAAAPAQPVASRRLDASPYIVRLEPDNAMTVQVRDYECTVPIAPEDAQVLAVFGAAATMPAATPMPAAASVPAKSKVEAGAAPAAGPPVARPATPSAGTPTPGAAAGSPGAGTPPAEPAPVVLPPAARQAVVLLVRERYRALIEGRCGPLPR